MYIKTETLTFDETSYQQVDKFSAPIKFSNKLMLMPISNGGIILLTGLSGYAFRGCCLLRPQVGSLLNTTS